MILIPWSAFWDRNYFAQVLPSLRGFLHNNFVRGAVSGLGVVNVLAALAELADIFGSRARRDGLPNESPQVSDRPGSSLR
ncbi:MAG TPA: hypothetical protein VNJ02_17900 [Vicinamibacterales bacterium]|nr:hypothetical protein [Vicinamibacterales bacterium]